MTPTTTKASNGPVLLTRLRKAITLLLMNINLLNQAYRLTTLFRASSNSPLQRRVSFDDGRRELIACADPIDGGGDEHTTYSSCPEASSPSVHRLQRTTSYPFDHEDVDKKAEMFIANFYSQLRLEKQISLELRYCRRDSFGSKANLSPSSSDGFSISLS